MPDVLVPVESPAPLAEPAASRPCAACAAPLTGRYCSACGERSVGPEDESLAVFLREQFAEVTSADGRLWRTVKALFVPGKLTEEYLDGRRGLYVRPVRIFLVLNVVLFFALSGSEGTILNGPLQTHYGAAVYGSTAKALAADKTDRWGVPMRGFESAFNAQGRALAPSLVGVLVPAFALLLAVLLWPARASGMRHAVLATHLVAALIALVFLLMLILEAGLGLVGFIWDRPLWTDSMDPILVPLMLVSFVTYIGVAVRRVYGVPRGVAAVLGVVLGTAGFAFAFWCFRLVLFAVTFWTLDPPT